MGKVELDNVLLNLWCMKKAMPLFSLITLTGISFTWHVSLDLAFRVLLKFDQSMYIQNKNLDYLVLKFCI